VLGTTGEGILLGQRERRVVAELAVANAGTMAVIVHCGAQTTAETRALAEHAALAGADGVSVIGPPYFAFDAEELTQHFAAAAAACAPLPFYVYECAARSGYTVAVPVVQRLRELAPNLTGLKVSDSPFERVSPYLATGLDVFIGDEALVAEGMRRGAAGAVSGVAAAFPEAVSALVRDPNDERAALAVSLRGVLSKRGFHASVKAALAQRGLPLRPDVRPPLRPLSSDQADRLRFELERVVGASVFTPCV
jgi:dihydrodipicolinate synthase/N-acetylneuraminate lyase